MKVVSFDKRFTTLYNYTGRILTVVDRSSERQINHPLKILTLNQPNMSWLTAFYIQIRCNVCS